MNLVDIDWNNPSCKISKYFTVKDALFLPSINTYHIPSDEEKQTIFTFAKTLDSIREIVQAPIIIHAWIRPTSVKCTNLQYQGFDYNAHVGSTAKKSAHISGNGADFHVRGFEGKYGCDSIRGVILHYLDSLVCRMEDIQSDWIHIDTNPVKSKRFFKP